MKKSLAFATAAVVSLCAPSAVWAAEAAASAAASNASALDAVVVTARRREERLQDVPLAVSALSDKAITQAVIVSPQDLQAKVPSLQVTTTSTGRESNSFAIRGIAQGFQGGDPSVIVYFAEVPTASNGPGLLFDLQNIQVLKGPQGTLFGRNTTGGAVLIEPHHPTADFGGYARVSAGSYNLSRVEGAINVPLVGDKLLARVSFDLNKRKGFTEDIGTGNFLDGRNYAAFRLGVTYRPNEVFDNFIVGNYVKSDTTGSSIVLDEVNPAGLALRTYPTLAGLLAAQQARGVRKVQMNLTPRYEIYENWGVTDIATLKLSDAVRIKNVLGFSSFSEKSVEDADGTSLPLLEYAADPGFYRTASANGGPTHQWSDELQASGDFADQLDWLVGVYHDRKAPFAASRDCLRTFGGTPGCTFVDRTDSSTAIFSQATWSPPAVPGLKLTAGLRYTWDKRHVRREASTPITAWQDPAKILTKDAEFSAPTYTLSADYHINPAVMVYAVTRRGYKSGGFNTGLATAIVTFNPEYLTDYEVGAKTEWDLSADLNLRLNLAIFRGNFTDQQIAQAVFVNNAFATVTTNAGASRTEGAEVEWNVQSKTGLGFSGYYDFLNARYLDYFDGTNRLNGHRLDNTPRNKASGTLSYEHSLAEDAGDLRFAVSYRWQDNVTAFRSTVIGDPLNNQKAYGVTDLRFDWYKFMGHNLDVGAFATNITDEVYKIYHISTYNSIGSATSIYSEPRMYGVDLKVSF